MPSSAISTASVICADRTRRAAAMYGGHATAAAGHVTEFQNGMFKLAHQELAAGRLLALPAIDAILVCLEGELWLTRDGDIEDYILGAGHSLHLRRADQAAVQALKPSRLRLIAA